MGIETPSDRLQAAMRRAEVPSAAELARQLERRTKEPPAISSLRSYVNGTRNPPLDIAIEIGRILNVSGRWLFDGKGRLTDPNPPIPGSTPPPGSDRETILVPLMSWVSAGSLTDASTQAEPEKWLPIAGLGRGDYFALEVRGDSMDMISPDGSTIVVDRNRRDLKHGRAYVFLHGNETTYKLWNEEIEALMPYSSNRSHNPIPVRFRDDLSVIGQVRRTMLDLRD